MSDGLEIQVLTGERATVVRPGGEVDVASVGALRQQMQSLAVDGHVNQVLDLTDVTFLDSAGLGAIVSARRRLRGLQGTLVLAGANERIMGLLRLTSMHRVLPVYATVREAIEAEFAGEA